MSWGGCRPRRRPVRIATLLALGATLATTPPAAAGGVDPVVWSDVYRTHAWARAAIDHVGARHDWMRDFAPNADGTYPFRPDAIETRGSFARAVVAAFAPAETPDASVTFADLPPDDARYASANVAVRLGWIRRTRGGGFAPDRAVTTRVVHRALVLALGLGPAADALDSLHTEDGATFRVPKSFGALLLGMRLGLRHNNRADESLDVGPTTKLTRAQVAYSLFRAATQPSYAVPSLLERYGAIALPPLGPEQHAVVQWGLGYVGYPYVWGGEWGFASPEPRDLGGQPVPGFDCSGLAWWLLRADDGGGWEISPPRPYEGWALDQRASADMARSGDLGLRQVRPGDLMFYDGDRDGRVDHVNVSIGNGWALDSSSSIGGVTIVWVGSGWYRDHFTHGRRVIAAA